MAKKDPLADALAKVAALKRIDDRDAMVETINALLGEKSSYVVSRVADAAAERGVRDAVPTMVARLTRLFDDPKSDDVGSAASLAIVKALITLEAGFEAEDVAIHATRHARWEKVMGGSVDVAVAVRGHAAILLAAMGSPQALRCASELLAEPDQRPPRERTSWPARADAARALGMIGTDGASAVLRFKLLVGDNEPAVLSDCLSSLLLIERDAALPLAERMIASGDDAHAEAAILALGGWRDSRAFDVLHAYASRLLDSRSRELYLASIAMTRQPKAIEYLFGLAAAADRAIRPAAIKALEPLRVLPGVGERLDALK